MTKHNVDTSHERIVIDTSDNDMVATIRYNLKTEELNFENRGALVKETAAILKEDGIVYGLKSAIFLSEIEPGKSYVIAEGTMPKDGTDCSINMFETEEVVPETIEGEKTDYYNMCLIPIVQENTWLGERIECENPIDGYTVKGEIIKAKKGLRLPLNYDINTVYDKKEGNKTVLYSKVYGAVYYKGKSIALMNPLVINDDVGFKTGNIVFNGSVIVNGSICDGFYVEATNDIEVNSEIGLGNIKGIKSTGGSIYIRGGVISKGLTKLEAAKNIYTKFVENVTMICGGKAHIGFYCSNSTINAKEVIIDSMNGKILGGSILVQTRVVSPYIGSELGKKTVIEVAGFNREAINKQVEDLNDKITKLKREFEQTKHNINHYAALSQLDDFQASIYIDYQNRLLQIRDEIKEVTEVIKSYDSYLNTRGDGEIKVTKTIFRNTSITIKKKKLEISSTTYSTAYCFSKGKIVTI